MTKGARIRPILKSLVYGALILLGLAIWKSLADKEVYRSLRQIGSEEPVVVTPVGVEERSGFRRERFTIQTAQELAIPVTAMLPASISGPHAAIVFMYGIGMDMDGWMAKIEEEPELRRILEQGNLAVFVPEQYERGVRKVDENSGLTGLFNFQKRMELTVREAHRVVDALEQRADIDPERIYLWGISFGAITGIPAMAYDPRFRAGIFTAAAGDFPRIAAESAYLEGKGFFSKERLMVKLLAYLLRPFDPVRHIGSISPRPILLQNVRGDELFPDSAVNALYDAAAEPKQIRWIDSSHSRPASEDITLLLIEGLEWLEVQSD